MAKFCKYIFRGAFGEVMQKAGNWGIMEKMQIWLLPVLLLGKILWGNIMNTILKTWGINNLRCSKKVRENCGTTLWKWLLCLSYFESKRLYCLRSLLKRLYRPIPCFSAAFSLQHKIGTYLELQVESNEAYLENKVIWLA